MILDLFAFLMIVSIILIIIGFVFNNWSAIALIGFAILFILSFIILNTGVQVETGATVQTNFTYNENNSISSSSQSLTYEYQEWSDGQTHTIGYLLSVVGLAGGVFVLWTTGIGALFKR